MKFALIALSTAILFAPLAKADLRQSYENSEREKVEMAENCMKLYDNAQFFSNNGDGSIGDGTWRRIILNDKRVIAVGIGSILGGLGPDRCKAEIYDIHVLGEIKETYRKNGELMKKVQFMIEGNNLVKYSSYPQSNGSIKNFRNEVATRR